MTDDGGWEREDSQANYSLAISEMRKAKQRERVTVLHGDCREVLKTLPDASLDACVTDPPYALVSIGKRFGADNGAPAKSNGATGVYARASAGFMGQKWDTGAVAFDPTTWREVLRVLKPGGHVLAFGGTRTFHRLVCAIEDAGFEVRDSVAFEHSTEMEIQSFEASLNDEQRAQFHKLFRESSPGVLAWQFGSGFPKSHDVSKAIDKAAGAEREVVGTETNWGARPEIGPNGHRGDWNITAPATDAARQWAGWGTALKPAMELICVARKPLIGTVAANVQTYGTGALNIDGCRIASEDAPEGRERHGGGIAGNGTSYELPDKKARMPAGRWPANVTHDGSAEVLAGFPQTQSGNLAAGHKRGNGVTSWDGGGGVIARDYGNDSGSAARFFYTSKADAGDRLGSKHPTVKPVDLMAWLCRLVTPPGGVVLDPFAGSGATGMACLREGFRAILIEREAQYVEDIRRRVAHVAGEDAPLFAGTAP